MDILLNKFNNRQNRRPNGPCKDNPVDLEELENAVKEFLKKD